MQPPSAKPFHVQVRAARLAAHWTQAVLAEKAGCQQSQLSDFEHGVRGKVSRETVLKIAELLHLEPPPEAAASAGPSIPAPASGPAAAAAHCPNFECPSNLPYFVGGQLFFLPLGTAGDGEHCALCGELLERECPHCHAHLHGHGGCCPVCGAPLLEMPEGFVEDAAAWAESQRTLAVALRDAAGRR